MGGYGASSGRKKDKCYKDTGNHKVTDKNAIEVAEYYIKQGDYVAFLKREDHPRADLSVNREQHIEVKGITTLSPNRIEAHLEDAFIQIHGDDFKYPKETHREGTVVLLSRHDKSVPRKEIIHAVCEAYGIAKRKGEISGKVELWIKGEHIKIK